MTLDTLIICAGAFVALLPFLGFPQSWDTAFFFLAGIFVVGLGIAVRRKRGTLETLMRKNPMPLAENLSRDSTMATHHEGPVASE